MASVNKVIVLGNLGRDPETRYNPEGAAMTTISVATSSSWKDKNTGEKREETEWHRITFFGRLAEVVAEYMKKGSQIYVEGRLRTRKYQDKETGQDRYATEIIGDSMQMIGSRQQREEGGEAPARAEPARAKAAPGSGGKGGGGVADLDDDIPF